MEPVVERALVFTDIVDSTALEARLGDAAARATWAAHDRQARDLVARHRGREIDRTDGFFLLFEGVADAVGFALGYHAALAGPGSASTPVRSRCARATRTTCAAAPSRSRSTARPSRSRPGS
jgi:class 3 adenylate cyclase